MMEMDYAQARQNMIDGQLRPNKVSQAPLLNRIAEVPREVFVPQEMKALAYMDAPIALTPERELLSPMVQARLIQALAPEKADHVLVVAAGSGYSAAILAGLVGQVVALEEEKVLQRMAHNSLADVACSGVIFKKGELVHGAPDAAPYDKILLDAAIDQVPAALFEQLKSGGTLAAVVQGQDGLMEATVYTKQGKTVLAEPLFETSGTPLNISSAEEVFVF